MNINTGLDVMKHMGIEMEMSEELRRKINHALIPNLSLVASIRMINAEKEDFDMKHAAAASSLRTEGSQPPLLLTRG